LKSPLSVKKAILVGVSCPPQLRGGGHVETAPCLANLAIFEFGNLTLPRAANRGAEPPLFNGQLSGDSNLLDAPSGPYTLELDLALHGVEHPADAPRSCCHRTRPRAQASSGGRVLSRDPSSFPAASIDAAIVPAGVFQAAVPLGARYSLCSCTV